MIRKKITGKVFLLHKTYMAKFFIVHFCTSVQNLIPFEEKFHRAEDFEE